MISDINRARVEHRFGVLANGYKKDHGGDLTGSFLAGIMLGVRLHKTDPEASSAVLAKIEREIGEETESPAEAMEVAIQELVDHISDGR